MNSRKFAGRTLLGAFSVLLLLLAGGSAWSQNDKEKEKNQREERPAAKSNAPARPQGNGNSGGQPNAGRTGNGGNPNAGRESGQAPANNNRGNGGGNANGNPGGNPNAGRPSGQPTGNVGGNQAGGNPNAGRDNGQGAPNRNVGGNNNGGNNNPGNAGNNNRGGGGNPNAGRDNGFNRDNAGNNRGGNGPNGNAGGRPAVTAGGRPASGFGPTRTVNGSRGFTGRVDAGGRVTTIRGNGLVVNRGARGETTIITRRPDNTRIVSFGPQRGFIDRPVIRNGRPFVTRTYVVGGRSYAHVYAGVSFRGAVYYRYVPPRFYAPGFYLWVGRPWYAPVRFSWGWGPWFGFYGYYFTPYPVYADASLWLTDYLIAQNLQATYDAQQAAASQGGYGYAPPPPDQGYATPLSPELKQAIDDEVRAEMARESGAAANPQGAPYAAAPSGDQPPDALDPNIRTFIVASGLNEQLDNGNECPLAAGDVLTRIDDTPDANGNVRVLVSSAQRGDCASGTQFSISLQDLQDMHNAFREHMDEGLNQLSQNQGKNGLPMGPAGNPTPYAAGTAQPDPNAQSDLQAQQQAAQQAEQDVQGGSR